MFHLNQVWGLIPNSYSWHCATSGWHLLCPVSWCLPAFFGISSVFLIFFVSQCFLNGIIHIKNVSHIKPWGGSCYVACFLSSLSLQTRKTGAHGGKWRAAVQVQKKSRKLSQKRGFHETRGGKLCHIAPKKADQKSGRWVKNGCPSGGLWWSNPECDKSRKVHASEEKGNSASSGDLLLSTMPHLGCTLESPLDSIYKIRMPGLHPRDSDLTDLSRGSVLLILVYFEDENQWNCLWPECQQSVERKRLKVQGGWWTDDVVRLPRRQQLGLEPRWLTLDLGRWAQSTRWLPLPARVLTWWFPVLDKRGQVIFSEFFFFFFLTKAEHPMRFWCGLQTLLTLRSIINDMGKLPPCA